MRGENENIPFTNIFTLLVLQNIEGAGHSDREAKH